MLTIKRFIRERRHIVLRCRTCRGRKVCRSGTAIPALQRYETCRTCNGSGSRRERNVQLCQAIKKGAST